MKKIILSLLVCGTLAGGVIPEPQSIEYGPIIRVKADQIKVTAPDHPAARLALEFLELPANPAEPALEIRLQCGEKDSENYRISCEKNRITVDGEGPAGMFNGAMTLHQLIRRDGGYREITLAEVSDGPVWKERFMGDYAPFDAAKLEFAAKYKYGGLAFQYRAEWHKFTAERYRGAFAAQKRYLDAGVLKFMLVYHIYAAGKRERALFNIASESDLAELAGRCRFAYESGFRHIMICADDWTPLEGGRYVLISPEEKRKFGDSAGKGHGYLMTRLRQALPGVQWSFCPPVYSLSHTADALPMQQYLKELGEALPKDIPIVWTGPQVISRRIEAEDEKTYSGYAGGHKTLIWDNSECDPYPIHRWETHIDRELAPAGIFVNAHAFGASPWMQWFGVTANDYLWNPGKYDSRRSLAQVYGRFRPHDDVGEIEAFQQQFDALNALSPKDDFKAGLAEFKQRAERLTARGLIDRWVGNYLNQLYAKLESPRPQLEAYLISQPPLLDGQLDDPCWQGMAEHSFQTRNGQAVAPGRRGWVKVVFDREAIYFAFRLEVDRELADTIFNNPDHDLFNSADLVEIFLKPNDKFIQFALDHRGHRFNNMFGSPAGFKPVNHWEGKIHKTPECWTAEIKIPFKLLAELGAAPPTDQTAWSANFCREYNAGKELQCWSPTHANSFLNPEMFGAVRFRENRPASSYK